MKNLLLIICLILIAGQSLYAYTITSFRQTQLVASGVAPSATDVANFDSLVGISGGIVEDFEDNTLISGLTMSLAGVNNALPSGFRNSNSVLAKNFWDGADSIVANASTVATFSYAPGASVFALGLGDIESDLRVSVNGEDLGLVRSLPNYERILDNAREVYIRIDLETGDNLITNVSFSNSSAGDGIFYDHLVVLETTVPEPSSLILGALGIFLLLRTKK